MDYMISGAVWGTGFVVCFLIVVGILKRMIYVCPANAILVVSGRERVVGGRTYGYRIVRSGWTFVVPYLERVEALDLTIIPVSVQVEGVNSANGITVGADATACVCIDDTDNALLNKAVERLLGKSHSEIQEQIQMTMVGNFRGALNRTTPLQAIGMTEETESEETESGVPVPGTAEELAERSGFRELLLKDCSEDLASFGVRVVSVSLQRIWDTSQYIANLANKTLSRKRKEVEIEEARLKAMAERAESDSTRQMQVARNRADQKIITAVRELEVYRQQCEAQVQQASLEADSSIAQADNEGQRRVQEAAIQLQELKNRSDVVLRSEAETTSAGILAEGDAEATKAVQGTKNDLLKQRVDLLSETGDYGKIALFMSQLPRLFSAFAEHGKALKVDNLLVMNEERGFDEAVNRGPSALVDFLGYFEEAFGVSVRELLTAQGGGPTGEEVTT